MEWFSELYNTGFGVMGFPFILGYKPSSMKKKQATVFPQCGYQIALVATLPSEKSNRCVPDYSQNYNLIDCDAERNAALMFNIIMSKSKLCHKDSRVPFLKTEQSAQMLAGLIDLFSPQGGLVIDPFAGSLTTSIAAMCGQSGATQKGEKREKEGRPKGPKICKAWGTPESVRVSSDTREGR